MRQVIAKFDIHHWVKIFMTKLKEVKDLQQSMYARRVGQTTRKFFLDSYAASTKRLLFLDYDGTLVGFKPDIEQAKPDEQLYDLLKKLSSDPFNDIVIVSGRDCKSLENWFGHLNLNMIAEHGAWTRTKDVGWENIPTLTSAWKKEFIPVLETFTDRTPGAFIEEKDFSLVWHFRKAEEELGELRKGELLNTLRYLVEDKGLQLLPGNKVVEVKSVDINKGKSALKVLKDKEYDFIMAIGDDHTDEDIFKALPEEAFTIKVGTYISAAKYYLNNYVDVRHLLQDLYDTPARKRESEKLESKHPL